MDDLPMLPKQMKVSVIKKSAHQFANIKKLLLRKDVKEVVIATDAGREGELVARWILLKAGYRGKLTRLWISSQTDQAIKEGFAKRKDAKAYDLLYRSAACRAEADWLVGLNITRALTCHYHASLSAGRVQTPTLAMIVEREEEIRRFQPKEYMTLQIDLGSFHMQYQDQNGNTKLFDLALAKHYIEAWRKQSAVIQEVQVTKKKVPVPQLYDLTTLQMDANQRYGYSAKETLQIMQNLYEVHKLLTYPRTDSCYISQDIVPTLTKRLKAIAIDAYQDFAQEILKKGVNPTKRIVDDTKVSDHHAIIPTDEYVNLAYLSTRERHIYDLVIRRFLAALSTPCVYEDTKVFANVAGSVCRARGKRILEEGWKKIYHFPTTEEEDEENSQSLPHLVKMQEWKIKDVKASIQKTTPPARYSEATLLAAMEHPQRFIKNSAMKAILKETGGIGTVATRADIIEKLLVSNAIEKRGNVLYPLSKGIQLIQLVPEELKSVALTAKWEQRLQNIAKGKEKDTQFLAEIRKYTKDLVDAVKQSEQVYRHDNRTNKKCPICDAFLLEINGKKGKMLVCSNHNCKYKQTVSYISNARCPNCHKKMQVIGEQEKKRYICSCGFKEKFTRYNEELRKKHTRVSQKDLQRFLKQQDQQASQEKTAFQLAWEAAQKNNLTK